MMALVKDMQNEKEHPGHPKLVISNNINAEGLVFAKQHSIETFTFHVEEKQDRSVFEEKTLHILKKKKLILSASPVL